MPAHIRVTSREKERIIEAERKRRHVARLLQVRDQSEKIARAIREDVASEQKAQEQSLKLELEKRIAILYNSELQRATTRRRSSSVAKTIEKSKRKSTSAEERERIRLRYRVANEALKNNRLLEEQKRHEARLRRQNAEREANAVCRGTARRQN